MHSQNRMMKKVELADLKEYIRTVKDPLEVPPIPLKRRERKEVMEYESRFKPFRLRTQEAVREGVNRMIEEMMRERREDREKYGKREAKEDTRVTVKYSPMVKIGNWQEERDVAEEDLNRFLRLRERGQLRIQQTRQMFAHTLSPVQMAVKKFVQFGDSVQLIAKYARSFKSRGLKEGLALSCVLQGSEAGTVGEPGIEGTVLSGSPLIAPCLRNVFQLCPADPAQDAGAAPPSLTYGTGFVLQYIGNSPALPYYVTVLPNRIIPNGNASRHPQVHLSSRRCWANVWRAYHVDPDRRKDTLGKEIPGNSELVVVSAILNRNLCCETHCWFSTVFGIECEATAFSYQDIYGKDTERNIWYFN